MIKTVRSDIRLVPDPTRVVARPFMPGTAVFGGGPPRVQLIVDRVEGLSTEEVARLLDETRRGFGDRHDGLEAIWDANATAALEAGELDQEQVKGSRRLLLGAFFTHEYAVESAGLCNPSIVPHPDGGPGRFVISLRAIGEGHISSVEFRSGTVEEDGSVDIEPPAATLNTGTRQAPIYSKQEFTARLLELGPDPDLTGDILASLGERFAVDDLDRAIRKVRGAGVPEATLFETVRLVHWVATSNYEVAFPDGPLSERVLVPAGPADSHGIEDVRLVRFVDEDGSVTYYGTYTAFDGFTILPQLIETRDFRTFRISTFSGSSVRNKGMALFPRRIGGRYVALGRQDRESIHLMTSSRLRSWNDARVLYRPQSGWETIQTGNCGPPIETDRGWLVLTHGVGPMRRYTLGALLLDLDHPERLLGRLDHPLLEPEDDERDGYVPNVVYSCGGMVAGHHLIIPYGFSDWGVGFVTVVLDELLDALRPPPSPARRLRRTPRPSLRR